MRGQRPRSSAAASFSERRKWWKTLIAPPTSGSPTTYLVDPADHFAAIRRARAQGRSVVGAYHSHPRSPAIPSPTDVREAHDPDFVYLIVSLADPRTPDVRGYRLSAEELVEVQLVVVG